MRRISVLNLGGLIRNLRRKNGINQKILADFHMGGLSQTWLSRLETGVVRPTRREIDLLFLALRASFEERVEILFVGGFLPTKEEVALSQDVFDYLLFDWSRRELPCAIIDSMSWRFLAWNDFADQLFGLNQAKAVKAAKISNLSAIEDDHLHDSPQFLEMIFDSDYELCRRIKEGDENKFFKLCAGQFNHFFSATALWEELPWHRRIMRRVMATQFFVQLWPMGHKFVPFDLMSGYTEFCIKTPNGNVQPWLEFSSELSSDKRFRVLRYVPDISD